MAVDINVDVSTLNHHDATEYRYELIYAIYNPGSEYEAGDTASEQLYRNQQKAVEARISELETAP